MGLHNKDYYCLITIIIRIYNTAFFGSVLWNLNGEKTKPIIKSWSVAVRNMWNLPVNSHCYFVEPLGGIHAKSMLISRYISFIQNLIKSSRPSVIFLLQKFMNNLNTATGRNIRHVLDETGKDDIFEIKIDDIKIDFQ